MAREKKLTAADRIDAKRVPLNFFSLSKFNLTKEFLDKNRDYVYSYIPNRCQGEELTDYFHDKMDKGWVTVEGQEYHNQNKFTYRSPLERKSDEFIHKGGQYLMKRSKEIDDLEKEFWRNRRNNSEKVIRDHIQINPQRAETIQDYNRKFGRKAMHG